MITHIQKEQSARAKERHFLDGNFPYRMLDASGESLQIHGIDVSADGLGVHVDRHIEEGDLIMLRIPSIVPCSIPFVVRWSRTSADLPMDTVRCGLQLIESKLNLLKFFPCLENSASIPA